MCTLLDLTVVAMNTSAWLMKEVKIPLGSHAIQNLAMTVPPVCACVMVKEQEGNEIMVIFKEFFEHGYMPCHLKYSNSLLLLLLLLSYNLMLNMITSYRKEVGRELT